MLALGRPARRSLKRFGPSSSSRMTRRLFVVGTSLFALASHSFQIGGAVGVAILSTVAVSQAHGADPLSAMTNGFQSAFATAIVVAAVGVVAAGVLLGRRRANARARVAEPATARVDCGPAM